MKVLAIDSAVNRPSRTRAKITFYGRIPSKKNSKQIVRGRLISSKAYIQWEEQQILALDGLEPLKGQYAIAVHFWLPDARKTDLSNKFESIADCLVKAGILEDDNCGILPMVHLVYRGIDRTNPRAEVTLEGLTNA